MNSRLYTQYEQIEHANLQNFLNNEVSTDTNWGKNVFGVTMQIDLDENVKDEFARHINNLKKIDEQSLLFPDRSAQHISCNQVIQWNLDTNEKNQAVWNHFQNNFVQKFLAFNQKISSFFIRFEKIIATTEGIIWCAFDDNDEMEYARKLLLDGLPKSDVIPKPIHIIHTTIARYKKTLHNPSTILEYIRKETASCEMKVRRILLREEIVYPTLHTNEIASIELV